MTSINTPKIEHDNLTNLTNTATYIFALGGLEEIGKNMYCFEQANEIIVIDVGIKFVDSASFAADLIVPDFSYLIRNKEKIKAIFITHGHEDHIGGVPYLLKALDIPFIYAPRLAAELIRDKLHKFKIKTDTKIVEIDATTNQNFNTKHFKIEYFQINHSIPDSYGIMIETINGIIVSTGDFKFD